MSQHDYAIANDSGANVRVDINDALGAIQSQNSGSSAPSTTAAQMVYADTTKGHYRRRNAADSGWLPFAPGASTMVQAKTAAYTVAETDFGTLIDYTSGTVTLSLTAAATLGDGFWFEVRNSGSGVITIDPNASELIDGATTATLSTGESFRVWCTGSAFKTVRGGAALGSANVFSADQTIASADAGATTGPLLILDRNSASPAASDAAGSVVFRGRDSGGNETDYASIVGAISDPTNGSEDGSITFRTLVAGSDSGRATIGQGLVVGSPTGGDKGAGTVNATAVYDDNVLLTDYVFDVLIDGAARAEDGEAGARFDAGQLDPDNFAASWREHRHLPAMPSREEWRKGSLPVGALLQRLWETVEVQAVHIEALNARLKALESGS